MPSGTLGRAKLAVTTDTTVYTVPTGKTASLTVNFCNQSSSDPAKVRLSLTDIGVTANTYMEYDANIPASGVLERGAIVAAAGESIIVRASTPDVSVLVYGIEE